MAKQTVNRNCESCGKEFQALMQNVKIGRGKYCSHSCATIARVGVGRTSVLRICKECGKEFTVLASNVKRGEGIYCSRSCSRIAFGRSKGWEIKKNGKRSKEYQRKMTIRNVYGLEFHEVEEIRISQQNRCAICSAEFTKTPFIDHNHDTGKVRGLLCLHCNNLIGFAREDTMILQKAIQYLSIHEESEKPL